MPDTIVALSSAPGPSASGLVRLSGPDAKLIVQQLLQPADRRPETPESFTVRGASRARLAAPLPALPVLVLWLPGPGSFTGEDTVELEVPGHPALLARVVREAERAGARAAEPGEFSHRAFEAGKLSLLGAEGTAAAIAAQSDAELAAAEAVRGGGFAAEATAARDALVGLLALVEAGIDFTEEEDVVAIAPADLLAGLAAVDAELGRLLDAPAAAARSLPRVALAGPPSAGKSSLFNALLGRERAVTDAAFHTTRDALEEELTLPGGARVLLVDTPGGEAGSKVEADLFLWFGTDPPPDRPHLAVAAKADLRAPGEDAAGLAVSAYTGEGLPGLLAAAESALAAAAPPASAAPAPLTRHREALARARAGMAAAAALCGGEAGSLTHPELVADALTRGVHALGSLTGELTPDDLIASVFTSFCIGK